MLKVRFLKKVKLESTGRGQLVTFYLVLKMTSYSPVSKLNSYLKTARVRLHEVIVK